MTVVRKADTSARARLASATRPAHLALHRDKLLCQLSEPDLKAWVYVRALRVFLGFHAAIEKERRRLECWPRYTLAPIANALDADLKGDHPPPARLHLSAPLEVLGCLYVAHGSMFGRNQMRQNVRESLPDTSMTFMDLKADACLWKSLCADLESAAVSQRDFKKISSGADKAFALMADLTGRAGSSPSGPHQSGMRMTEYSRAAFRYIM